MSRAGWMMLLLLPCMLQGQSRAGAFFRLSGPEKTWTLLHPFKAGRAWKISRETRQQVEKFCRHTELDTFNHGGKLDAFRHTFWMARLTQSIGPRAALKLGKAHERGNFRQFKKGKGEDGNVQDSIACVMDLRNNEAGIALGKKHLPTPTDSIAIMVIDLIRTGNLTIMKRNAVGQLCTCEGLLVTLPAGQRRAWALPYCLVRSNNTP
ncbi:MAG: hypothetical protein U0Y08_06925 [Bacteroidia bacterium]